MSNNDLTTNTPKNYTPKLLTEKGLSEECKAIIGESNLQNYYSRSKSEKIEIFTQIIEYIIDTWPNRIDAYYKKLPNDLKHRYRLFGRLSSNVIWENIYSGEKGQGVLPLLAHMHGTSIHEEAQKLDGSIRIPFSYFRASHSSPRDIPFQYFIDNTCYAPKQLTINNNLMVLDSKIPFIRKSGDIHSYLCVYKSNKNKVSIIPTGLSNCKTDVNSYMDYCSVIGMAYVNNFLNKDILNKNPHAKVFWPMDLLVANKLHSFVAESKTLEHKDYVIVGYYGSLDLDNDKNPLDLTALITRDVVLLPEISRQGMLDAVTLAQKCIDAGAKSVKICTSPCLPFPSASTLGGDNLPDPWEREIVSQAIDLEAEDVPANIFKKLEKHSMSPSEFIAWGKECAVFKDKRHEDSDLSSNTNALDVSPVSVFPASDIEEGPTNAPCDLDCLISAESRTMLYSPTEHGKSFLVLHLALAIAYGGQTSLFKATKSRKALILDGETGPQQFKERIKEVQGKYKIDPKDKDNFYFLGIKGNSRCKDFNLSTEESQQAVFNCCKAQAVEVLIFDNVATLWPKAATSTKELDRFLGFIKQVEGEGIAVIVAHHSTKDGQSIKGLSELESLFQNVIALEKPSESDHKQHTELQQYVDEQGALCKCTLCPAPV